MRRAVATAAYQFQLALIDELVRRKVICFAFQAFRINGLIEVDEPLASAVQQHVPELVK